MLSQRIQQQFIDSADFKYQCAQPLAAPIESAVHAIFASVTNGGKLLIAGAGATQPLAQYVGHLFLSRFERNRPELAAITLGLTLTSDTENQSLAREVRALGVSEDLLLVLSVRGGESSLSAAVDAAHERDMTVVALVGGADGELLQTLHDTDVAISIPADALGRVTEIQQMALHCICDGIDIQLLGEQQ